MADPVAVSGVPSSEETNVPAQLFAMDRVEELQRRLTVLERYSS